LDSTPLNIQQQKAATTNFNPVLLSSSITTLLGINDNAVSGLTDYTEVLPVPWEDLHSYTHHSILQVAACTDEGFLFSETGVLWKIRQSKVEQNIPF